MTARYEINIVDLKNSRLQAVNTLKKIRPIHSSILKIKEFIEASPSKNLSDLFQYNMGSSFDKLNDSIKLLQEIVKSRLCNINEDDFIKTNTLLEANLILGIYPDLINFKEKLKIHKPPKRLFHKIDSAITITKINSCGLITQITSSESLILKLHAGNSSELPSDHFIEFSSDFTDKLFHTEKIINILSLKFKDLSKSKKSDIVQNDYSQNSALAQINLYIDSAKKSLRNIDKVYNFLSTDNRASSFEQLLFVKDTSVVNYVLAKLGKVCGDLALNLPVLANEAIKQDAQLHKIIYKTLDEARLELNTKNSKKKTKNILTELGVIGDEFEKHYNIKEQGLSK